ncbi:MAG: CDP-glucose 4,6-dehydratase [Bradyrhizobium sp.]|nr:MAG: CDP-glucose 4,6-dehydratase [Bradyrhizobium sp.]
MPSAEFWRGRRVLLTGHTGFKGAWTALWLKRLGARVTGFALAPQSNPALYDLAEVGRDLDSRLGDLRDAQAVRDAVVAADPQIVLHLAAQPLVRRALADPAETIAVNALGLAHLLDALRGRAALERILVVTSDKVYDNRDGGRAFTEDDPLGGKDPYSASKAAAEIIARAYAVSYFAAQGVALVTARGGNVIGGGDWAQDRIVPDIMRAWGAGKRPRLRMPEATRPWQHALDCIAGYLIYAEQAHRALPRALNFGPDPTHPVTVAELTRAMLEALGAPPEFDIEATPGSIEMRTLAVDAARAKAELGWRNRLLSAAAIRWTADWHRRVRMGENPRKVTLDQIDAYCAIETVG